MSLELRYSIWNRGYSRHDKPLEFAESKKMWDYATDLPPWTIGQATQMLHDFRIHSAECGYPSDFWLVPELWWVP